MPGGTQTLHLLVAEDDQRRAVAVESPPGSGVPSLARLPGHPDPVRVVLDLALPRLSGVEIVVQLRRVDARSQRTVAGARSAVNVVVVEGPAAEGPVDRWASLTSAEVEVSLLAAAGLTNRQISAQLFTSPRTTETHLAHIYRKLCISGRTQLAAEVARRALATGALGTGPQAVQDARQ